MESYLNKTVSTLNVSGQDTGTKDIVIKSGNEVVNTNKRRHLNEVRRRVADNAQVARIVEARGPNGTHPRVHQPD